MQNLIFEIRGLVEHKLDEVLPEEKSLPRELHRAMRYSVLGGGKRLRAVLCAGSCLATGGAVEDALLPAAALEILHAYTLIHDDLPAMDDDDMRRGKPSCHRLFGEAEAILAGDALLTLAFEVLSATKMHSEHSSSLLVYELARAGGSRGVVGGQYEDVKAGGKLDDERTLEFIQTHKTADLIRVACRLGGIVGAADDEQLRALDLYGHNIGIAFQIADDILDEVGEQELIGKPVGSDRGNHKLTSVSLYGLDDARRKAEELVASAHDHLKAMSGQTDLLEYLADLMVDRDR